MKNLLKKGTLFLIIQGTVLSTQAAVFPGNLLSTTGMENFRNETAAITVKGTIVDASGLPLPGVTIVVQGSTSGTVSDANGAYSIVAPENGTLVFSFIGLKTQSVEIGNRSIIDVTMVEDISALEEVVVTSFGMAKEQKSLGYATTTIKAD